MRGILSKLPDRFRKKIISVYGRMVEWQYAYQPVYVARGDGFEPYWLDDVTHRVDPDGVSFYLRCRPTRDKPPPGQMTKKLLINIQLIESKKGRYVYEPEKWKREDREFSRDPTGSRLNYPRGERYLGGHDQTELGESADGDGGGVRPDGPGEPQDDQR